MDTILSTIKKVLPKFILRTVEKPYHFSMAFLGALYYRFPSKKIYIVGITGTKGKSTTAEIVNAILEEAGKKTAMASTIRFKIGDASEKNLFKMTMPGRFFLQRFLRKAVDTNCAYAILEMTSEGVEQFRHKFINLDALIFTNLAPEHIESHGSLENYFKAKFRLATSIEKSSKKNTVIISNEDDAYGKKFLKANADHKIPYALKDAEPYITSEKNSTITNDGLKIMMPLIGIFNIYNALAAISFAKHVEISNDKIRKALETLSPIKGRVEYVNKGQPFSVVVDYAHTPDSLEELYKAFKNKRKICVLGNTGGGRDKWKRPQMGAIAEKYCDTIILTNEDPYDENPRKIVDEMADGMDRKPEVIMDRRKAIQKALQKAKREDVVLITGKGTDPYIMEKNGKKTPWSDVKVVEEELESLR